MGADTKKLKTRIRSVSSTMHITKAMELVASSKMKRASMRLDAGRPYTAAIGELFGRLSGCDTPFTRETEQKRPLCIVIAGDRGLAGGYNNDVFKTLKTFSDGKDVVTVPIGKRACDHIVKRGYNEYKSFDSVENFALADSYSLGKEIAEDYLDGKFDAVYIIYTEYVSMLSREVRVEKILPIEKTDGAESNNAMIFEPNMEEVLDAAVPEYISGKIYGYVSESFSSELAARRNAMDSATKNASEMIDALSLKYNRARQGAITQEITEIIGGAEAQ